MNGQSVVSAAVDQVTVRLPHTGIRVPDRSLRLTRLRQRGTHCGVAFTARLWANFRHVGHVDNDGIGGGTRFHPAAPATFDTGDLAAYALRCASEEGHPVSAADLLDALVGECEWTRQIDRATRKGATALRLMDHATHNGQPDGDRNSIPPYPHGGADSATPHTEEQWDELTVALLTKTPPGPNGWWQAWTGHRWRDVTRRPDFVNINSYA